MQWTAQRSSTLLLSAQRQALSLEKHAVQHNAFLNPTRRSAGVSVWTDKRFASSQSSSSSPPPFHLAFPVHDLDKAKKFYGEVLGCEEGRSSDRWQDYSLYGHQIVAHLVKSTYRGADHFNPVDKDDVPVPHYGVALGVEEFHALAKRLKSKGVKFIIEPHLRFEGRPGEQWTMFFKDPSGNNLEFKAMTNPENLFAKYYEK